MKTWPGAKIYWPTFFLFSFKFYLLILERERGRRRKKKTSVYRFTNLCIHWLILVCALTGNWTCDPRIYKTDALPNWVPWPGLSHLSVQVCSLPCLILLFTCPSNRSLQVVGATLSFLIPSLPGETMSPPMTFLGKIPLTSLLSISCAFKGNVSLFLGDNTLDGDMI